MGRLGSHTACDRTESRSTDDVRLMTPLLMIGAALLGVLLAHPAASFGRQAAGDPEAGRGIFLQSCQHCHGRNGRGDGELAQHLTPPPADLSSPATQAKTDDELRKVIIEGRKGTAMAGFEDAFGDAQLVDLVAFIRSLKS